MLVGMCDHCGCRAFAPIADLTAEHEVILGLAWELAEAPVHDGDVRDRLLAILDPHVVKEERGLYPRLAEAGRLDPAHGTELEDEHRDLRATLLDGAFDRRAYYALAAHVEEEELELFSSAMLAFDEDVWAELDAVHEAAVRPDIATPEDVAELVRRFYARVADDDLLGPLFNDVARVDWSEHLPKLTAFWCRALFAMPGYQGNPYRAHQEVHARQPFTAAHFHRWLDLFDATLETGWQGPNVAKMRALADKVARVHSAQIVGEAVGRSAPTGS